MKGAFDKACRFKNYRYISWIHYSF